MRSTWWPMALPQAVEPTDGSTLRMGVCGEAGGTFVRAAAAAAGVNGIEAGTLVEAGAASDAAARSAVLSADIMAGAAAESVSASAEREAVDAPRGSVAAAA